MQPLYFLLHENEKNVDFCFQKFFLKTLKIMDVDGRSSGEVRKLYKSWRTVNEILHDRGYAILDKDLNL